MERIKVRFKGNNPNSGYGYYETGDIGYVVGYTGGLAVVIKENGSFVKTELSHIEEIKELKQTDDWKLVGQNPAWSEEDEKMFNSALWHIKNSCGNQGKNSGEFEVYNWLKTIKYRYLPQPKHEWSEEDERIYQSIMDDTVQENQLNDKQTDWLKSLKDRVQLQNIAYYNPYKEVVNSIAEMCEKYAIAGSDLSDFLCNVRVKCKDAKEYDALYPQNGWKPSGEQMEVLKEAVDQHFDIDGGVLWHLYQDLKKLREK